MMNSMIKENGVTFKELEKNIYAWVCQIGREFTKEFLERYDRMLMEDRDKKKYRNKGARQTTVKTVYGEVTYQRMVYEVSHPAVPARRRQRQKQITPVLPIAASRSIRIPG